MGMVGTAARCQPGVPTSPRAPGAHSPEVPGPFARGGPRLLEKPRRSQGLSRYLQPRQHPQPGCQAGVEALPVSIRVEGRTPGSQEGRAGRLPWKGAQPSAALYTSRRGSRLRLRCRLHVFYLVFLASSRPRLRTGAGGGHKVLGPGGCEGALDAGWRRAGPCQPCQHDLASESHARGTGIVKGLALFSFAPLL